MTTTVALRGVGGADLSMPLVGLGTWRMGNASETRAAVGLALSIGYRALDCALGYNNQEGVGAAVAASGMARDQLWITSKIPGGLNNSATTEALERSIAQLGVGYVDLMLLHYPASWSGVGGPSMRKEAWLAMEEWARRTGKAKALGVSHYCKRHLEDVFSVAREPVALNQVQYHVGMGPQSGINASLRHDPAYDHAHGVVYAAYSSLCGPCPAPDNKALITGPLVTRIGAAHGKSGPQVALRWAVQRGIPVIPKSTHAAHLKQNLDLFSWSLSSEEMDELDRAQTPVETGTPPQPKDDAQDCLVP
jgi:diketogulonate reductase-like aldo/keto reductase